MTNLSPLRQLSREYFEGQIDRAYYVQQRRYLIASLASEHGNDGSSPSATIPGLRREPEELRPDSNDLANALANLPTAATYGFGAEALPEHSASVRPGEASTQDPSVFGSISKSAAPDAPSGSSLTKKLLLLLWLLPLSLVVWLFFFIL